MLEGEKGTAGFWVDCYMWRASGGILLLRLPSQKGCGNTNQQGKKTVSSPLSASSLVVRRGLVALCLHHLVVGEIEKVLNKQVLRATTAPSAQSC